MHLRVILLFELYIFEASSIIIEGTGEKMEKTILVGNNSFNNSL
jgi:hypothetical protein